MKTILKNRKINFEYELIDAYEAGILLNGLDVKHIRAGKMNISDAFCYIKDSEIYLRNAILDTENVERKLLLHKQEIRILKSKVEQRGLTIVPVEIYDKCGLIKIKIALAKGKTTYDKKFSLKGKNLDREKKKKIKTY